METMIERVVRAIEDAGDLDEMYPNYEQNLRLAAVHILKAMREPTADMVKAGEATSCEHGDLQCGAKYAYINMIEAALGHSDDRTATATPAAVA